MEKLPVCESVPHCQKIAQIVNKTKDPLVQAPAM